MNILNKKNGMNQSMKENIKNKHTTSQDVKTGLFDEPIQLYHATRAVGSTHLRTFMRSRAAFAHMWTHPFDKKTEAMTVGSALHCMVLEPHKFKDDFVVAPEINRRTKAGKEEWEQFQAINAGKEVLKPEHMEQVRKMSDNIMRHNIAEELLKDAEVEKSARVSLSNGLITQCRPDAINNGKIIDVKTCQDVSKFHWDARSHKYNVQAAFYYFILSSLYPDRFEEADFYFIAVDKSEVCDVRVYGIDNATLQQTVSEEVKPTIRDLGYFLNDTEDLLNYVPNQEEIDWLNF